MVAQQNLKTISVMFALFKRRNLRFMYAQLEEKYSSAGATTTTEVYLRGAATAQCAIITYIYDISAITTNAIEIFFSGVIVRILRSYLSSVAPHKSCPKVSYSKRHAILIRGEGVCTSLLLWREYFCS